MIFEYTSMYFYCNAHNYDQPIIIKKTDDEKTNFEIISQLRVQWSSKVESARRLASRTKKTSQMGRGRPSGFMACAPRYDTSAHFGPVFTTWATVFHAPVYNVTLCDVKRSSRERSSGFTARDEPNSPFFFQDAKSSKLLPLKSDERKIF